VTLPAVKIIYKKEVPGKIGFEIPVSMWPILVDLVKKIQDKRGGYAKVTIDLPSRPRSTGEKSQNHRINGFIQQICVATGNDFDTVKMYCKVQSIAEGYPCDTLNGKRFPWSESRIDTKQAAILIGTIERLAAELDIRLEE